MTRPNHRPTVIPDAAVVRADVPGDIALAIDCLAKASGVSRATFVRSLIFAGLQPFAITDPELAAKLPATTYTRGAA